MKTLILLITLILSQVCFAKTIDTDDKSYLLANKIPLACHGLSSFKAKLKCLNNVISKSNDKSVKNVKTICNSIKNKNSRTIYTCYNAELVTLFVDPLEDVKEL